MLHFLMVSVSSATRLAYDNIYSLYMYIYILYQVRTYADLTLLFLSEVYDLFQLLCLLSSVFIFLLLR